MAAKHYYTLLIRDDRNSAWRNEFGDWDRETVEGERDELLQSGDEVARYKSDTKIIRTNGQQCEIDAKITAANDRNPRLPVLIESTDDGLQWHYHPYDKSHRFTGGAHGAHSIHGSIHNENDAKRARCHWQGYVDNQTDDEEPTLLPVAIDPDPVLLPIVGERLDNGALVVAARVDNDGRRFALCHYLGQYVSWRLNAEFSASCGHYFDQWDFASASDHYSTREY